MLIFLTHDFAKKFKPYNQQVNITLTYETLYFQKISPNAK